MISDLLIANQVSAQTSTPLYKAGGENANNIDSVSKDFEAVFLSQMMGAMFSGDEVTNYFGSGTAGEVYKSTLLNEYGKMIAQSGGIGIAAQVKQELLKLQETGKSV